MEAFGLTAVDDNLIDGRGLSGLIHLQPSSIEFPFQSVSLVQMRIQKRTRVQMAPAAIVCTGYDTVGHFGRPVNATASSQIMLVYDIPLWPQAARKTVVSFWPNFGKFILHFFWQRDAACCGEALLRGGSGDQLRGHDSRGLAQSFTPSSPHSISQ